MALSNWATLAFDGNGNPCRGVLQGFNDFSLEIYKNWIYVNNPNMWTDNGSYSKPTIASINSGVLDICNIHVVAARNDLQNAIFVVAKTTNYPDKNDYSKKETRILIGIGCCGYSDPTEKLIKHFKLNRNLYRNFATGWSSHRNGKHYKDGYITLICYKKNWKLSNEFCLPATKKNEDKFGSKWIGVTPKLFAEFLKWLKVVVDEEDNKELTACFKKIKSLNVSKILNYNQGDLYFQDHGINVGNPLSKIKKPKKPIFEKLVKKLV